MPPKCLNCRKRFALINDTVCRECRMDGVRTDVSILYREYDEFELVGDATTILNNHVSRTLYDYGYDDGYFRIILPKPIWEMDFGDRSFIESIVFNRLYQEGAMNVLITYDRRNGE